MQYVNSHRIYEKDILTGSPAHWRGIYDDNGRLMAAICHNMDLGDSWEETDEPTYPQISPISAYALGELHRVRDDALR